MPEYQQAYEETLPEGVYDFVVVDAIEKQSQNGNPMIELQLMVNGPDGSKDGGIRIFDHLTFTPKSYWKIDSVPGRYWRNLGSWPDDSVRERRLHRPQGAGAVDDRELSKSESQQGRGLHRPERGEPSAFVCDVQRASAAQALQDA